MHSVWKRFKTICHFEIIQQDKFNVIASELERARQSRSGFCGLLRHSIPRNDNRVFAFTLAEVLITLVIIGVIAALTIPNLMQNYKKHEVEVKLKKAYNILSNTTSLAVMDNGTIDTWTIGDNSGESSASFANTYLIPYLKVRKNCGTDFSGECAYTVYYTNGDAITLNSTSFSSFILDDGTYIAIQNTFNLEGSISVTVDINGNKKKPNIFGKDVFTFIYALNDTSYTKKYAGKLIASGANMSRQQCIDSCKTGYRCASLIMWNSWKVPEDYPIKL